MRWLLAYLPLTACAHDEAPCLADRISITQGVYGVLQSGCEIGGCPGTPHVDAPVWAGVPTGTPRPAPDHVADTRSDSIGFYEMTLEAGDYDLCFGMYNYYCTRIRVGSETLTRYDWAPSGPLGEERWSATTCTP